jgi:N-acetylglucosamine-6-phosphate deacetylase
MTIVSPGFFDLQVNGFAGVDFNDPACSIEDLRRATEHLRATGVTRYLPALISSSFEAFARCARNFLALDHPAVAGLHMEGPYISPADGARGAHSRAVVIDPSIDDFKRRQEAAGGRIVLVTLAPERPRALDLIEYLVAAGVRVAIGHTEAAPHEIRAAISAGATLSTHLGNGCAALLPRHPNLIWEQLAADELFASLIVDGHHLPPATVKAMIRAKGPARTILVSDATAAAGGAPGRYRLGELQIELGADGRVAAPGTQHLAGSALTLNQAVANAVRFASLSLDEAISMAATLPARYMGRQPAGRVMAEWDPERFRLEVIEVREDAPDLGERACSGITQPAATN